MVVFSTSADPRDLSFCYAAGANAYHVKPVRHPDHVQILLEISGTGSAASFCSSRGGEQAMTTAHPGAEMPTPREMAESPAGPAPRPWRVAVIDDSPEERAEARRLLLRGSERRFAWIEAETGASAVRALLDPAAGPPDCEILDFNLPDMDALEVLEALAGPDGMPVCPVVLTGREGPEHVRARLRAGAQDELGKAWMIPESLTRAVENAVERRAMARELRDREAALEASGRKFRVSIEASPTAVAMVDQYGLMTMANAELERLTGYSRGEIPGRPLKMLMPDASRERHIADRRYYFREPTARRMGTGRELSLRRKDGSSVAVEIALSPSFPVGDCACVITDIPQRNQAEAAAREQGPTGSGPGRGRPGGLGPGHRLRGRPVR